MSSALELAFEAQRRGQVARATNAGPTHPKLFESPREAYIYMADRRCVSRTVQDVRRAGYLHSSRYFYVLEWQKDTEQVHFHVLLDASFIPKTVLDKSWCKHRPAGAGPIEGKRPGFGTVWITVSEFEGGAAHAARYVSKYLIKVPDRGFPAWVLAMGKERRVRRYSTSRGFWGRPSAERVESEGRREVAPLTYGERVASCGDTVHLFRAASLLNLETGEVTENARWIGELGINSEVLASLPDVAPGTGRRLLAVETATDAVRAIEAVAEVAVPGLRWAAGAY